MEIHLFHHFLAIGALLNAPMWVRGEGLKRRCCQLERWSCRPPPSAARYKRRLGCFRTRWAECYLAKVARQTRPGTMADEEMDAEVLV